MLREGIPGVLLLTCFGGAAMLHRACQVKEVMIWRDIFSFFASVILFSCIFLPFLLIFKILYIPAAIIGVWAFPMFFTMKRWKERSVSFILVEELNLYNIARHEPSVHRSSSMRIFIGI